PVERALQAPAAGVAAHHDAGRAQLEAHGAHDRRPERRARRSRRPSQSVGKAAAKPTPTGRLAASAAASGVWAPTPRQRDGGSTISRALPMTLSMGTTPLAPPPPCTRESAELLRLSPITQSVPSGTLNGSNSWLPLGTPPSQNT